MLNDELLKFAREEYLTRLRQTLAEMETFNALVVQKTTIVLGNVTKTKEQIESLGLRKSKGLYLLFANEQEVKGIQDLLSAYRKKIRSESVQTKQAVPRPNENVATKNGCLYVGMTKKNSLEHRLLQHFIGTNKTNRTTALKFHLWAETLKEVTAFYIIFPTENLHLIREHEKALWNYYQPARGEL